MKHSAFFVTIIVITITITASVTAIALNGVQHANPMHQGATAPIVQQTLKSSPKTEGDNDQTVE